jgi:hypothetical protein
MPFTTAKQIVDPGEFLTSFPRKVSGKEVKIILDPYFTDEGKVRFLEVKWQ